MCLLFQGTMPFGTMTAALTHHGWRPLIPAPRGTPRFKEGIPENVRNLVLLGKEAIWNVESTQVWITVALPRVAWSRVAPTHWRDDVSSQFPIVKGLCILSWEIGSFILLPARLQLRVFLFPRRGGVTFRPVPYSISSVFLNNLLLGLYTPARPQPVPSLASHLS